MFCCPIQVRVCRNPRLDFCAIVHGMRLAPSPAYSATLTRAPNGAAGAHHTLYLMRELIRSARTDPVILQAAHSIVYLTPEKDQLSEVKTLFEYVRDNIRYMRDVCGVETLCAPQMTLQRMIGDCDDQTSLLCALFEAAGYPTRLIMAEYGSGNFEHVYCQVLACDIWIDCDPTERSQQFGYAPPFPNKVFVESI
jgi:hypothetical protein